MIKDLSAKLVAAAAEINKKSREAYVAEQRLIAEKTAKKEMKMPGVPAPKADPAASAGTDKMVKTKVTEETSSAPKTPREKQLAAMSGDKKKITFGDVLKARGVKMKEEVEELDEKLGGTQKMLNQTTHKNDDPMRRLKVTSDHPRFKDQPLNKTSQNILKNRLKSAQGTHSKPNLPEEVEHVEEGLMDAAKNVAKKAVKALTGGSDKDQLQALRKRMGMKEGVTNAFDWKNTPSQIPKKPGELTGHEAKKTEKGTVYTKKPVKENMDTPGNSTHQCAIHVKSEQFGEGRTLTSQHAQPDELGNIAWYDVMFAEGIKRVETKDLEILVTEDHMNHPMKKKKAK